MLPRHVERSYLSIMTYIDLLNLFNRVFFILVTCQQRKDR